MTSNVIQSIQERYADLQASGWALMDDVSFPALGPLWHRNVESEHSYAIIAESKYLNRFGRVHGGVIASLADCALGRAARHNVHDQVQSTIDLNIHFIGAGLEGDLIVASGKIVQETRSMVFASGIVRAGDRILADASGIWKVHKRIAAE